MDNLFLDLGSAKNQEELEVIFEEYKGVYDKAFICACVIDRRKNTRTWMESLWEKFSPYADKDFLVKVRKNEFHQRTWEMYLGNVFLEQGFRLESRNQEAGPDLKLVLSDGKIIWVEAIAGDRGEGENYVPERSSYSGSIDGVDDPKVLRITACLKEKKEKFEKYIQDGIVGPQDICVIAINGHGFDGDLSEERFYMKALYGLHQITYNFETQKSGNTSRSHLKNKNQSNVSVLPFLSEEYETVSAVMYSGDHIINLPKKKIGSSLAVIHNQKASVALPENIFQFGIEHIPDPQNKQVIAKIWDKNN